VVQQAQLPGGDGDLHGNYLILCYDSPSNLVSYVALLVILM